MEQGTCFFLYDHVGLLTCGGLSTGMYMTLWLECNAICFDINAFRSESPSQVLLLGFMRH